MPNLDYDADLRSGEQRQLQYALCNLAYQSLKLLICRPCTLKLMSRLQGAFAGPFTIENTQNGVTNLQVRCVA